MAIAIRSINLRSKKDEVPVKERKNKSSVKVVDATVVYAQVGQDGQSVAVFETNDCGKIGYIPVDDSLAKKITESKQVRLTLDGCNIKNVVP
jgi:hypothetical protein